jgi:hypothetical protein
MQNEADGRLAGGSSRYVQKLTTYPVFSAEIHQSDAPEIVQEPGNCSAANAEDLLCL